MILVEVGPGPCGTLRVATTLGGERITVDCPDELQAERTVSALRALARARDRSPLGRLDLRHLATSPCGRLEGVEEPE